MRRNIKGKASFLGDEDVIRETTSAHTLSNDVHSSYRLAHSWGSLVSCKICQPLLLRVCKMTACPHSLPFHHVCSYMHELLTVTSNKIISVLYCHVILLQNEPNKLHTCSLLSVISLSNIYSYSVIMYFYSSRVLFQYRVT